MNLKQLDLNLLVAFEAIYSTGSISAAARRLGTSQPNVSNALSRLRRLVDDPLFVTARHGVEPTVRARQMIAPVREALDIVRSQVLRADAMDLATYERNFRIVVADPFEPVLMPPILREITERAPGVSIESVPATPRFAEELRTGTIDLACYSFPLNAPELVAVPIFAGNNVVISRRNHPLIGKMLDQRTLRLLRHIALVPELRSMFPMDNDLAAYGIRRRIVCAVNKFWSIPPVVEQSDLVCIVPDQFARVCARNFAVDLHEAPVRMSLTYGYVLWHVRSRKDPGHQWLRETIVRHFREQGFKSLAFSTPHLAQPALPPLA